jgi:hypothetical protein
MYFFCLDLKNRCKENGIACGVFKWYAYRHRATLDKYHKLPDTPNSLRAITVLKERREILDKIEALQANDPELSNKQSKKARATLGREFRDLGPRIVSDVCQLGYRYKKLVNDDIFLNEMIRSSRYASSSFTDSFQQFGDLIIEYLLMRLFLEILQRTLTKMNLVIFQDTSFNMDRSLFYERWPERTQQIGIRLAVAAWRSKFFFLCFILHFSPV